MRATLAQRQAFRRYLQELLLPAERNKMLTALTNVGVLPEYQGQGIGSRLIRVGLEAS